MPDKMQPKYKRQRFLLSFVQQLKDGATATDIQKLVFLYTMKEKSKYYEFLPYKYGPYSFQLAEDISILCKNHFFRMKGSHICAADEKANGFQFSIDDERGNHLIKKTYREYPYYSINSEIIGKLFSGDEAEKFKNEKKNYSQSNQMLFTLGYEGKSLESFMNILIQNDVHLLCDVRRNPLSRKFGFSKNKLEHISKTIGIKYVHIPELGIDSEKRTSLDTIEDYNDLFREYTLTLPKLKTKLEEVYLLLCSNNRIALMCFEKEPHMCHRHVIRDYLINSYNVRSVDL